jgi:hypothetical protein
VVDGPIVSGDLTAAHRDLQAILAELGIDIGSEVLEVWDDRREHERPVWPPRALDRLEAWTAARRAAVTVPAAPPPRHGTYEPPR